MTAERLEAYLSPEEYLEGEKFSRVRHEYMQGRVYAMAGASDAHETIAGNLFSPVKSHVRGKGCRAFIGGMKVRIDPADCFYYPDVFVTCDERDRGAAYEKRHPCLVVEVLSDSTEAFDRGRKFEHYQMLESLQEYVLIAQDRIRVERYRRSADGDWVLRSYSSGQDLQLESIDFTCPVDGLYEDVEFPPEIAVPDTAAPPRS